MRRKNGKENFLICITAIVCIFLFLMAIKTATIEPTWNIGDVLSFFGTIFLGIIAVIQTSNANKISERLMELEDSREIRPFAVIEKWNMFRINPQEIFNSPDKLFVNVCKSEPKELSCLSISLLNTTCSYISITYKEARYINDNSDLDWRNFCGTVDQAIRLQPMKSKEIAFWGNEEYLISSISGKNIKLSFSLENRFGEKYQEDIDCSFKVIQSHGTETPIVLLDVSNYQIDKK